VTDLVSNDDLETTLDRVVASARRAVETPAYVLALAALPTATRRVYGFGLDDEIADGIAARLLSETRDDPEEPQQATAIDGVLATETRSGQRHYGWLAAVDPAGNRSYLDEERAVLGTFASLAAAALDVATSLDDARRQTAVAEAASVLLADERAGDQW
jgi:GAF domain-containing protein